MIKFVSMLLAAVLSASLLAGCGASRSSGQQPTEKVQEKAGTDTAADTAANSDVYLVYVRDAETMDPIPGARVQFCSDVMCQKGKTDENGLAEFHSEPGTYTVHFMKAPDGYADSTEEFTLDKDKREATYFLKKQ
jgi:hypothetical protein